MKFEIVTLEGFSVAGLHVKTNNSVESDISTARIPGLWHKYTTDPPPIVPVEEDPYTYSVYSAYDRTGVDGIGNYSVTLGMSCPPKNTLMGGVFRQTVSPGKYAKFRVTGACPDVIIDGWNYIWKQWPKDSGLIRNFTSDFERYLAYTGETADVEIYIGLAD